MYSDDEMIVLAAKAAGIKGTFETHAVLFLDGERTPDNDTDWNPLNRYGDALRLAVKLNLHMGLEDGVANVWRGGMLFWTSVRHDGEPDKATRRAIVLCAAKIGEFEASKSQS